MLKYHHVPEAVLKARRIDWGLLVDAFLFDAAPFGDRFIATVFSDFSGRINDGETVFTPPLRRLEKREGFVLTQSITGRDHYVIVTDCNGLSASLAEC